MRKTAGVVHVDSAGTTSEVTKVISRVFVKNQKRPDFSLTTGDPTDVE